ncbi:hypothetical protein ACNKHS_08590 [Shigella flexneri]
MSGSVRAMLPDAFQALSARCPVASAAKAMKATSSQRLMIHKAVTRFA